MSFMPPLMAIEPSEAMRPVFLILMGLFLLLVAWRFARRNSGWPVRVIMAGAILLALGYSLILPLYDARVILPYKLIPYFPDRDPAAAIGWHLAKVFAMNGGWLLFGLGLALHARVFENLIPSRQRA